MIAFLTVLALSASHPAPRAHARGYEAGVDQRLHTVFGKLSAQRPSAPRQARTPRGSAR